jgi:uncharacterized protein YdbL (DUF1318 family)
MHTRCSGFKWGVSIAMMAALLLVAGPAAAQGVKERMAARLAAIDDLKARGVVGENHRGFLEFVGAVEQGDLVAAENADRRQVYAAIAQQTGTTPEVVGRRRALQSAENSRPGVRLQRPDGTWYTK